MSRSRLALLARGRTRAAPLGFPDASQNGPASGLTLGDFCRGNSAGSREEGKPGLWVLGIGVSVFSPHLCQEVVSVLGCGDPIWMPAPPRALAALPTREAFARRPRRTPPRRPQGGPKEFLRGHNGSPSRVGPTLPLRVEVGTRRRGDAQ